MSDVAPGPLSAHGSRGVERPATDLVEVLSPSFDRRKKVEREGLPSGYRMRADAHYVDQLSGRAADMAVRLVDIGEIDGGGDEDTRDAQPLVESIKAHGVLQPLLVRRDGARYQLIAGKTRLAAARAAGLERVPCVLHPVDAAQAAELSAAANVRGRVPAPIPERPVIEDTPLVTDDSRLPTPDSRLTTDDPRLTTNDSRLSSQLASDVAAIGSAAALLTTDGVSMLQRVAVDLIRAQTWRAAWLLRATSLVDGSIQGAFQTLPIRTAFSKLGEGLAAEARLSGIRLQITMPDWSLAASIDEEALICGLTGGVVALLGLVGRTEGTVITMTAAAAPGAAGSVSIRITEDTIDPVEAVRARFFEREWSERPGGWVADVGSAAVRAAAERHGGRAVLTANQSGGCTIEVGLAARR